MKNSMYLPFPSKGLYAITPDRLQGDALLAAAESAILGGAAVVQYRPKSGPASDRLSDGIRLQELCRTAGIPLIVNDSPRLAAEIGADGVHLGKNDGSVAAARHVLGDRAIVGISCYDSLERALRAEAEGANYVAFGALFPSATKPCASRARLETLREAGTRLQIPIVAIGGIDTTNGGQVIGAGADLVAAVEAVFGAADVARAARELCSLFHAPRKRRPHCDDA
ncbi:thiamine phosphate synthase [Methylococcus capsulatus]|uniref:thiamine phosphate synthase n=1 Tax=Methylococcus capsulatus TaxID=414 RepID=UPI001C52795A|nr:thiamine phosphate synthase [Methylococcus capsulatus]QXP86602.1 thiamine phosphate synthase [Methylococcus capsulatus]QXP93719.1 thiamine phosphate synthase [Methylococcus capsulatus]UQN11562.1 thiamine phosphate synthase [Methylococcus capsulatus]